MSKRNRVPFVCRYCGAVTMRRPSDAAAHCSHSCATKARYGSDVERFWRRVGRGGDDACWPWDHPHAIHGYGEVQFNGRPARAHVVAWTLTNGAVPDGCHVLHRCDNPPCCNPAHLFVGTQQVNVADMHAKGRAAAQPRTMAAGTCRQCGQGFVYRRRSFGAAGQRYCSSRCSALARWHPR